MTAPKRPNLLTRMRATAEGVIEGEWGYTYSGSGDHDVVTGGGETTISTCRSGWAISAGDDFELAAVHARFIAEAHNMWRDIEAALKAAHDAEQWMAEFRKRRDGYDIAKELDARDGLPAIHRALAEALGREDSDG